MRFPARIIAARDHGLEPVKQAVETEVVLHVFVARRGGDGAQQAGVVQKIQQFDQPRLQAQLQLRHLAEPRRGCPEQVEIEVVSAAFAKRRPGRIEGHSDRRKIEVKRYVMATVGGCGNDGVAV